jgi:hypothetical protein
MAPGGRFAFASAPAGISSERAAAISPNPSAKRRAESARFVAHLSGRNCDPIW